MALKEVIVKMGWTVPDSFSGETEEIFEAQYEGRKNVLQVCDPFHFTRQITNMISTMKVNKVIMAVVQIHQPDNTEPMIPVGIIYKNDQWVIWNDTPSEERKMIYPRLRKNEVQVPLATPSEVMAAERKPQTRE